MSINNRDYSNKHKINKIKKFRIYIDYLGIINLG